MLDREQTKRARGRASGWAAAGAAALVAGSIFDGIWMANAQKLDQQQGEERIAQPAPDQPADDASDAAAEAAKEDKQIGAVETFAGGGGSASALLHVPVTTLYPGNQKPNPPVENPRSDEEAAQRGMMYFNQMNCVGCHAPNGAGGMGPALSNHTFIYGGEPANIYLSILQGRPAGMPAWGGMLPDQVIWDLVAYIKSISNAPKGETWGKTVSAGGFTIEQVPAEFQSTTNPWKYTNPFSYGQAPFENPQGSPPLETPNEGSQPQ
ncbi:cytochrome c [Aurantimonas sp. VKM B-3413]|uniref:c-type cytochrome n=1 Tax=Aurantimonas sp. VKM B-3413 TaxID=2779401 RepID=UPI001E55A549|nr:cytochrome c [Aurantimonas sp. VKM B-3413]MCB8837147.1 cytochrome c [Aurantimonas sp. VKM B-3413]